MDADPVDPALGSDRAPALAEVGEAKRGRALERFAVLRPHLEQGVPLTRAARDAGVPVRTA